MRTDSFIKTNSRYGEGIAIDEDTIAEVVSAMTGVPLTRLNKDEAARLLGLED